MPVCLVHIVFDAFFLRKSLFLSLIRISFAIQGCVSLRNVRVLKEAWLLISSVNLFFQMYHISLGSVHNSKCIRFMCSLDTMVGGSFK